MTETQHLVSIPAGATKALRVTTHVLRTIGDHVGSVVTAVTGAAVVVWMANDVAGFAPVLDRITPTIAIVLLLAIAGAILLIETIAYGVADWIDPDARDGDDLWEVTKLLKQVTADVRQGADYDDVRLALQASNVLPQLYGLSEALRDAYADDGEVEEEHAISDAAALIRAAAIAFGDKSL